MSCNCSTKCVNCACKVEPAKPIQWGRYPQNDTKTVWPKPTQINTDRV